MGPVLSLLTQWFDGFPELVPLVARSTAAPSMVNDRQTFAFPRTPQHKGMAGWDKYDGVASPAA